MTNKNSTLQDGDLDGVPDEVIKNLTISKKESLSKAILRVLSTAEEMHRDKLIIELWAKGDGIVISKETVSTLLSRLKRDKLVLKTKKLTYAVVKDGGEKK
jgi:predicted transcriptional regulator